MFGMKLYEGAKNVILVSSGKGGVGKSTVAVNLAVGLAMKGYKTGLVDADIYGPSIPTMLGLSEQPNAVKDGEKVKIIPLEKYGVKVLSIGFFIKKDQPLIWRGPMASGALKQLFEDADWGDLDYMVIDMPPGTGDVHLTIADGLNITGTLIVTTPQKVAQDDVRRAIMMYKNDKVNIPIIGLVENMSYFTPAELPENKYYIFGEGGGIELSKEFDLPILSSIPIVKSVSESMDNGTPICLNEDSVMGMSFNDLAAKVIEKVKLISNSER